MNRRIDSDTAEKLHIAFLTWEAFGFERAMRYAAMAGIDVDHLKSVIDRGATGRRAGAAAFGGTHGDRRLRPRDSPAGT